MNITESPQLDTAATLAKFLNASIAHVRKMTRDQRIPVVRIGRRGLRFDRSAVMRALEKRGRA